MRGKNCSKQKEQNLGLPKIWN